LTKLKAEALQLAPTGAVLDSVAQ